MGKFTITQKRYLFWLGIFISILICYHFGLEKTIDAWSTNQKLNKEFLQATSLNFDPIYMHRKNENLDKVISTYKVDTANFRNSTINIVSFIANKENVKIINVPVQEASTDTAKTIVEKLELEGDFFSLLKVASKIQNTHGIGVIASEQFKLKHNTRNPDSADYLVLELYLQVI